jgi:hypothetical protein
MAAYNGGAYISRQLESFARQTLLPDELVVCDDGSTDDTVAQVRRFAATAPFAVRIEINDSRLGYSLNFGRAISLCTGDIVCLSDQDDIWFDEKIDTVAKVFNTRPQASLVVNDQVIADRELRPAGATVFGNTRKLGYSDLDLIAGCCTSFRASLSPVILPFPTNIAYDSWIGTMGHLLGLKTLIEHPLQIYRRHDANTSMPVVAEAAPSTWTLVQRFGMADPRSAWSQQLEQLQIYEERIRARHDLIVSEWGPDSAAGALAMIADWRSWLETRLDVLSRSRASRFPRVLKLWREGFYERQFGLKSAIKDLVRS